MKIMIRFDLSDLRIFVNVVQSGSITGGAERSHRAVASISNRIKEMESEMGTPLLIRDRTGVTPTEAGRRLLGHSYRLLSEAQRMNDDLSEYRKRERGFIKLACNSLALQELIGPPVSQFLKKHPRIHLSIEEMVNNQIPGAIDDGTADIGVMALPMDAKELETVPLLVDRYVIIVPSAWPVARGRRAHFAEFLQYEFVGPGRGTWMHMQLQQHAIQSGQSFDSHVQVRNFTMTCALVSDGLGVAIVPALVALRLKSQMRFTVIELEDDWARLPLVVCMRKRSELLEHHATLIDILVGCCSAAGR